MLNSDTLELNVPGFYPKQIEFMKSKRRYTAYGGARTWRWEVIRSKMENATSCV